MERGRGWLKGWMSTQASSQKIAELHTKNLTGCAAVAFALFQKRFGLLRRSGINAPFLGAGDQHGRVIRLVFIFAGHRGMNPRISGLVPERGAEKQRLSRSSSRSSGMAPRAYWKGFLRLSLVSCPIALYPATSEREKIHFHQLNRKTGNRIQYKKVDAETGREVDRDDIIKGYEKSKGDYVPVEPEELEAVAIESKRVIEIDEFVPRKEIDELYFANPYYIVPDGEAGAQAYAVIRDAIEDASMIALGRVVFTSREHMIALEARGKGIMGITLRYPYEVRDEKDYFDDIPGERVTKDMLDLASHIIKTKTGHFYPEKFEDQYEDALKELLRKKDKGEKIEPPPAREESNVINLMDALRRSVKGERAASGSSRRRRAPHRRKSAKKRATTGHRKAG